MTKGKKPKRKDFVTEKTGEDWCFVCKDGGDLMLCDYHDCVKVYHPGCVGKGDSFLKAGEHWTCDRHRCLKCHKSPKYYCYCCPNATCGRCIQVAGFAPVRGNKGFCEDCLELVVIVEEKEDLETDGGKIDLKDRDTFECLFFEYWEIIKEHEGLSLEDVYLAESRSKKGQYSKKSSKSSTIGKRKKDVHLITSDSDSEQFETVAKGKGSKEFEFSGWGSKPLIEFLKSLGKDTTEELSQFDVHSIINEYIQQKGLSDTIRKKRITCDESLYLLFRRKHINKNKIYTLLEDHFVINKELSNEELSNEDENWNEVQSCSLVGNEKAASTPKKQRTTNVDRKSQEADVEARVEESCFASIVPENIKLVYLRRSLVEQLSNDPKSFEQKVVGSFVRIKNDPRDSMHRNCHQLLQVTGIKQTSRIGQHNSEVFLSLFNIPTDVHISKLSDLDFCQEEIDDLRQIVNKGLLRKPTIVELEEKAKLLHEDITKDWIEKELIRLQKRIDFANEKGRRRELHGYLEQLELLKKPSEQERLMKKSPKVTAELVELKTDSVALVEEASPEEQNGLTSDPCWES